MGVGLRLGLLIVLGFLSLVGSVRAAAPLVLIRSPDNPAYTQAAQAFELAWRARTGAELVHVESASSAVGWPSGGLWVALGSPACALAAAAPQAPPLLCALLPRAAFVRLARHSARNVGPAFSALYLDPPLHKQLDLIARVWPDARRVGVLLGPESVVRLPALRVAMERRGWTLDVARGDPPDVLPQALQHLQDVDVLLALPDPQVFNTRSVQPLLLTTFRSRIPVLAFSPAYVRSGALLSLHVSPEQAGRQAATLALAALASGQWPAQPREPWTFEVAVNPAVAQAWGLRLQADVLARQLSAPSDEVAP